ncbi:MAG: hypothetical protein LBG97_07230, partial [Coriobacteriales bacterium]|nr:hypothetical protein [Coriobacteriales bacterium]
MGYSKKANVCARRILGVALSVLLVISLFPTFSLAQGDLVDAPLAEQGELSAESGDGAGDTANDATATDTADNGGVTDATDPLEGDSKAEAGDAQSDDAEATEADGENASDQGESVSADNSDAKDNPQDETPLATGSISGVVWADGDPNNGGS